jgi:hypothetical protein
LPIFNVHPPFPSEELRKALDNLRTRHTAQKKDSVEDTLFWALKDAIANYNTARKAAGKDEV